MKKIVLSELIKFLTIGAIGIIPNYIMYNLLILIFTRYYELNFITQNISWFIGVASGGIFNYIASKNFVFGDNKK